MAARRQLPQRHVRPTHPPPARATGLVEVQVAAFPLVLTDLRGRLRLHGWVAYAIELGGPFDSDDKRQWRDGLAWVADEGGFLFVLTHLVCSGRRP